MAQGLAYQFPFCMQEYKVEGCHCPVGFRGDGKKCEGNHVFHCGNFRQSHVFFIWSISEMSYSVHSGTVDADIDECKERSACQCDGCSCKDTWGGYECKCKGDLLYIAERDACIGKMLKLNHKPSFKWQ